MFWLGCYIVEDETCIYFGNNIVELKIDRGTGFFRNIFNKMTRIDHKAREESGVWPFGLRLGHAHTPDLLRAEIVAQALHPQKMSCGVSSDSESKMLEMHYDDLMTTGGGSTGIALTVYITLKDESDYYLIRARLVNKGKYEITKFFSGGAELVADATREKETLVIPTGSYGTMWSNPYSIFVDRETFGYPICGSSTILEAGWFDLYGEKGGIGLGYVNRQGLSMYFNVQRQGQGMNINWQFFNLTHDKAAERFGVIGGIYPLRSREEFTTDYWFLAPHAGDWHRMADIYRAEYEEAFKGDYPMWEDTHEVAKRIDMVIGYNVFNPRHRIYNRFSDVPPYVKKAIDYTGILSENLMVAILSLPSLYLPDWLPCHPESGGDEGCKRMVADLRNMGIEAILFLTHTFFNHPKANDYVAEADTGNEYGVLWADAGNWACTDCDAWVNLWKDKYVRGYDDIGASGLILDQGPAQFNVCVKEGHRHGTDSIGMLSAGARGTLNLLQVFREGYRNRRPFFYCETGSDVSARTMDIWSCAHLTPYAKGGVNKHEIVRYTFPYRLCTDAGPTSAREVNEALVNGFILGGWMMGLTLGRIKDLASLIRQFVKVRRRLREDKAPGFPYGFKDTVGLQVGNPSLVARVYRDNRGITVLYYAQEDVETTITVDKEALGFPGTGDETIHISLEKNQANYKILTP